MHSTNLEDPSTYPVWSQFGVVTWPYGREHRLIFEQKSKSITPLEEDGGAPYATSWLA